MPTLEAILFKPATKQFSVSRFQGFSCYGVSDRLRSQRNHDVCFASWRELSLFLSLKNESWQESRASKKQWQFGFLSKDEYVTIANAFVDASAVRALSSVWTVCWKKLKNRSEN
ncbi:hypothetical protein PC116_g26149 [Phytophthora cactorum]|uniref:Uncharacterized protein n=2 Tax=Phytophthora cactorum TaxID=29920 RepID=A0A8T1AWX4_9STRA|nr:hypothetical protein Pcac1_g7298 [Phytophthora cactorum]KAG2821229.1 hypothetical protein PC111_g11100 [Phytophthora cactorum]KAG2854856.1 hypothetical protein PC113_g12947 [Phytophthora cactorum]KAG2876223.1 hypothetical protein PC114_g24311 [Phytophthora cactorum]KAG2891961.1 hypothetical protein PC117_g24133 [Phytophthora cactorum]